MRTLCWILLLTGLASCAGPSAPPLAADPSPFAQRRWRPLGEFPSIRYAPAVAFLNDREALVAGGHRTVEDLAEAFVLNLGDGRLSPASPLPHPQRSVAALPLPNGDVAFMGHQGALNLLQVYDIQARRWRPARGVPAQDQGYEVCDLPGVGLLIAGGSDRRGRGLSEAYLYVQKNDAWSPAASLRTGRFAHTLTRLDDGRILAVGGFTVDTEVLRHVYRETRVTGACEIYDPAEGRWMSTAGLDVPRGGHAAVRLGTGEILVTGGRTHAGKNTDTCELYDPRTNTWTTAARLPSPRSGFRLAGLPDGDALLIGGHDVLPSGDPLVTTPVSPRATFVFRARSRTWTAGPPLLSSRSGFSLAADGRRILIAAGFGAGPLPTLDVLDLGAK